MTLIILLFMALCALINLWIIRWFWRAFRTRKILRLVVCLGMLVLAAAFPLLYKYSGASWPEIILLKAGAIWAGAFLYIFLMTLVVDLVSLGTYLTGKYIITPQVRLVAGLVILGLAVIITVPGYITAHRPQLTQMDLVVEVEPSVFERIKQRQFVIAAMSDLHLGRLASTDRLSDIIGLLEGQHPDVVLFVGDVLDDHILLDMAGIQRLVTSLRPAYGLWAVAGNHEYISGQIDESLDIIQRMGIKTLRDDFTVLGDSLVLVGRDDYAKTRFTMLPRANLDDIIRRVPAEYAGLPVVVMDHQPYFLEEAEEAGVALQLSGHTHYGQIWPFNIVVEQAFENPLGHSKRGQTNYIVSAGAGTWGPPIRNTASPEVLLIRLTFKPV